MERVEIDPQTQVELNDDFLYRDTPVEGLIVTLSGKPHFRFDIKRGWV